MGVGRGGQRGGFRGRERSVGCADDSQRHDAYATCGCKWAGNDGGDVDGDAQVWAVGD